jgi:hypothetical protein
MSEHLSHHGFPSVSCDSTLAPLHPWKLFVSMSGYRRVLVLPQVFRPNKMQAKLHPLLNVCSRGLPKTHSDCGVQTRDIHMSGPSFHLRVARTKLRPEVEAAFVTFHRRMPV